jgi:hypothetical protein
VPRSFRPLVDTSLAERLYRLGLSRNTRVTATHNRTVLVSWTRRGGLRLHAGYAAAPDDVLIAIVRFLGTFVPRKERLAARQRFMAFPAWQHADSRPRRASSLRNVPDEHAPMIARLEGEHRRLNAEHFEGRLTTIPIRLSERMRRHLGELRADRDGKPLYITMSLRHIRRDSWAAVLDTLLHEMVHQWQGESGLPLNHRKAFWNKALALGLAREHRRQPALPGAISRP